MALVATINALAPALAATQQEPAEAAPLTASASPQTHGVLADALHGPGWLLGAQLARQAVYPGAERQRSRLLPVLQWTRGPVFVQTTAGALEAGAQWTLAPGWRLGAQISDRPGVDAGDVRAETGLDIDQRRAGAAAGWRLQWQPAAPTRLLLRTRHGALGHGNAAGHELDLRWQQAWSLAPSLQLRGQIGATWADGRALQRLWGLSAAEAARNATQAHEVGAGLRDWRAGLSWVWRPMASWAGLASLESVRLGPGAAASPLVSQRQSWRVAVGLVHRLGPAPP